MRTLFYLTRQKNGDYMLTEKEPDWALPGGRGDVDDCYGVVGDGSTYRHLCPWFVRRMFGVENLPAGQSVRVWMEGGLV